MTDFTGKTTYQLSDLYGEWLDANGYEGDEPIDELLMNADKLTQAQRNWLWDFKFAYKAREEYEDKALKAWPDAVYRNCCMIADKWVGKIGLGFHPDTRGTDYEPQLSQDDVVNYEAEMDYLFGNSADPYAIAVEAMERAGLC
jgi:hypothetical protein